MLENINRDASTEGIARLPAARRHSDTKFSLHLISSLADESNVPSPVVRDSSYLDWVDSLVNSGDTPELASSVEYSELMQGQKVQSSLHLTQSLQDALHNLRIECLRTNGEKKPSMSLIVGFALSFALHNSTAWVERIPLDGRTSNAEFAVTHHALRTTMMLSKKLLLSCQVVLESCRRQGRSTSIEALKMTGLAYGLSHSAEWISEVDEFLGLTSN